MYKGNLVYLRLFEPQDYEKTYLWHNDYDLMKSTCGPIRFVSKEIEKRWVEVHALENNKDIYLAICIIETDEMIGWYSISDIDHKNQKCHCSGVIIGDKRYRDGEAFMEAAGLVFHYILDELNMNRISGSCLEDNYVTRASMEASFWTLEGIEREAIFKGGRFRDICHYSILRKDYEAHLQNGDMAHYEQRFIKLLKSYNNKK